MAYVKNTNEETPSPNFDSIYGKSLAMIIFGIIILIVSLAFFIAMKSADILLLGCLLSAFLCYKGIFLRKELNKQNFQSLVLLCTEVNKSGYRKQNQTVTFKKDGTESYIDISLPKQAGKFQPERKYVFYFRVGSDLKGPQVNAGDILGWETAAE